MKQRSIILEEEATKQLKSVKMALDVIHYQLFNGVSLNDSSLEEMLTNIAELNRKFMEADDSLMDLFMEYHKWFLDYKDKLKYAIGFLGGVAFCALFYPGGALVSLVAVYLASYIKETAKKYNEFVTRDTQREFDFLEIQARIKNYVDVLKIRKAKSKTLELANEIEIANEWIRLIVDEKVEIDYIPVEVQQNMVRILQFELGVSSGDLRELLAVVCEKNEQKLIERSRCIKKN